MSISVNILLCPLKKNYDCCSCNTLCTSKCKLWQRESKVFNVACCGNNEIMRSRKKMILLIPVTLLYTRHCNGFNCVCACRMLAKIEA